MIVLDKLRNIYGDDSFGGVVSAQIMAHYVSLNNTELDLIEHSFIMGEKFYGTGKAKFLIIYTPLILRKVNEAESVETNRKSL